MEPSVNILIVDDEEIVVAGMKKGLESCGWNVDTVLGGEQAIELCSKKFIDVVLVDLVMPGLDGVETCKRVKKLSPKSDVLLFSGVAGALENKVMPFLQAGGRDLILRKPLFPGEVEQAIKQLLGEKNRRHT